MEFFRKRNVESPYRYAYDIKEVGGYDRFTSTVNPQDDHDLVKGKLTRHQSFLAHDHYSREEVSEEKKQEIRTHSRIYQEFKELDQMINRPGDRYIIYVKKFDNKKEFKKFKLRDAQKEI